MSLDIIYGIVKNTNKHVVIICPDPYIRKLIHKFFDIKHFFSKRSIYISSFPEKYQTYFKCKDHRYHIKLSYFNGTMTNNMDEGYIGECPYCENSIQYEPAFDAPMEGIFVKRENNAIYLSKDVFDICKKNKVRPFNKEDYNYFSYKTGEKIQDDITENKFYEMISNKIPKTIFIYDSIDRKTNGSLGLNEIETIINKKISDNEPYTTIN
jgi:hypothetical protein